jgi:hypothetical protein
MTATNTYELVVEQCPDKKRHLKVRWADGGEFWTNVPEIFLDLMPFAIARWLLHLDYDLERILVVRLHFPDWGDDREIIRAPLGALATTLSFNIDARVELPPWHVSHYPTKRETLQ